MGKKTETLVSLYLLQYILPLPLLVQCLDDQLNIPASHINACLGTSLGLQLNQIFWRHTCDLMWDICSSLNSGKSFPLTNIHEKAYANVCN